MSHHACSIGETVLNIFSDSLRYELLFIIRIENDRAILFADVGTLPIRSGRIVRAEEDSEQVFECDDARIIGDADHFGMTGVPFGYPLVCRSLYGAACVSGLYPRYSFEHRKYRFCAPEASTAKYHCSSLLHVQSIPPESVK